MELLPEIVELQTLMDDETYNHCNNVKNAVMAVSGDLGLDQDLLGNACAILDIGKLLINEYVFHKAELLSRVERELMDLHSYLGYRICMENGIPGEIAEVILYHHGGNVPHLSNVSEMTDEIRQYAEVVHTIDAFEALTEERGYRPGYSKDQAYAMMEESAEEEHYRIDVLELLYEMNL